MIHSMLIVVMYALFIQIQGKQSISNQASSPSHNLPNQPSVSITSDVVASLPNPLPSALSLRPPNSPIQLNPSESSFPAPSLNSSASVISPLPSDTYLSSCGPPSSSSDPPHLSVTPSETVPSSISSLSIVPSLTAQSDICSLPPEVVQLSGSAISLGVRQTTLQDLRSSLVLPNNQWSDQSPASGSSIKVCKLLNVDTSPSTQPLVITHCLTVDDELNWSLFVYNHPVASDSCIALRSIPLKLTEDSLFTLINVVDQLNICAGHPEQRYITLLEAKKGILKASNGSAAAYIDNYAPITLNGKRYSCTVRTTTCELLVNGSKCQSCGQYRGTLRSAYHRFLKRKPDKISELGSHTNLRYMTTPEKVSKIKKLSLHTHGAELEIRRLRGQVEQLMLKCGETVEAELHDQLVDIMKEKSGSVYSDFPEGTFGRLFWEQQLRAATASNPRQVRWHPLIIRWCLNLKLISSAAYHATRTAGFIKLPSERTLRDYTHYFKHQAGFQEEVVQQLMKEAKVQNLPEYQRYCGIIFDEMKIKENLVYDKYTGCVVGFVNLGDINNDLSALERRMKDDSEQAPIANHLLVLLVRGIFFKLEFPFAHFGTVGVTADQLFPIIWEGIRQVESIGLQVIFLTADGASVNRKFFRMHQNPAEQNNPRIPIYKTINPFAQDQRPIFFVSDPSHLIKTSRNCWSHSDFNGTRLMTVS